MQMAICDDSREDRKSLRKLLEAYAAEKQQTFEIAEYSSGIDLCADKDYLQACRIIFLDINMEDMDGLETARQIKAVCSQIHIILVTAYINYALDGYKVKASRFLIKDELVSTIYECMDDILEEIKQSDYTISFSFVEGNVSLRMDEIIYIETNRHKNLFYTKKQTYSIYKKLDDIEMELKGQGFVRIHQSFLVNMRYIQKISSYVMKLTTGKEISVPKSRYPEVKRQYTLFKGAE